MGCLKLTYQTNLKPVYRVREKEVARKEKESRQNLWETVDTGNHYYGARYYNSNLSIWISVDPITKAHESPYSAFSGNPVMFIDPDGRDTTHADNATRLEVNRTYNAIENGISKSERIVDRLDQKAERKGLNNNQQARYQRAAERICELSELKASFDKMINDEEVTYHFISDNSLVVFPQGQTYFNDEKGRLEIRFERGQAGTLVHEARHGAGFGSEWTWVNGQKAFVDYNDEYEGYRAGNLYNHHILGIPKMSHDALVRAVLRGVPVNIPVWDQILVP